MKVENSGRILLPAEIRKKMGIEPGAEVIASFDVLRGLCIHGTRAAAVRRAQQRLRAYSPERVLSEELISDRRREADKESRRGQ